MSSAIASSLGRRLARLEGARPVGMIYLPLIPERLLSNPDLAPMRDHRNWRHPPIVITVDDPHRYARKPR